jgi:hypothetical protein
MALSGAGLAFCNDFAALSQGAIFHITFQHLLRRKRSRSMTTRRLMALALLCAPIAGRAGAAEPPGAAVAPAQKSSCTAVSRGKFHLRPRAQVKSAGPEFPKGTALTVLLQLPPPESKDHRPIYQVQVQKTGATGYVYLRHSELGAACPIIWPGSESVKAGEPVKAEGSCLLSGPAKSATALYSKKCDEPRGPDKKRTSMLT